MTKQQQLRAGQAYNLMNDYNCGTRDVEEDPTGEMGWIRMTYACDIRACSGERSYEDYLDTLVSDVLSIKEELER
jgi:hypothetical protein